MTHTQPVAVEVAGVDELPPGGRLLVAVAGREIGLFEVGGELRAVLNICPHAGAPICLGTVRGTTLPSAPGEFRWGREGEILACPWHGWEFSLLTGETTVDRRRLRLLPVEVVGERIAVRVPARWLEAPP